MSYELIGISVLWLFLFGYLIVASIDFGAGFFAFYARLTKQDHLINRLISRYLSPVWEITNVFFVFFTLDLSASSRIPLIITARRCLFREALRLS